MLGFISFRCQPRSWNNYIFPVSKRVFSLSSLSVIASASVSMPAVFPYKLLSSNISKYLSDLSWSGQRLWAIFNPWKIQLSWWDYTRYESDLIFSVYIPTYICESNQSFGNFPLSPFIRLSYRDIKHSSAWYGGCYPGLYSDSHGWDLKYTFDRIPTGLLRVLIDTGSNSDLSGLPTFILSSHQI